MCQDSHQRPNYKHAAPCPARVRGWGSMSNRWPRRPLLGVALLLLASCRWRTWRSPPHRTRSSTTKRFRSRHASSAQAGSTSSLAAFGKQFELACGRTTASRPPFPARARTSSRWREPSMACRAHGCGSRVRARVGAECCSMARSSTPSSRSVTSGRRWFSRTPTRPRRR